MFCKYCGARTQSKGKFCKKCGKHLPTNTWLRRNKSKLVLTIPIIVVVLVYCLNAGYLSAYVNIFPFWQTSPKTTTLTCAYAGKNLKVDLTLYENINKYYQGHDYSNKKSSIEKGQFNKLVYVNPKDQTIKKLIKNIKSVAMSNHLNDDQTLELTTCFIQNIPYDEAKSNIVLKQVGNTADTEQYPYQTLYINKGICTDKTYLGSALLKELGYGTSIMAFNEKQHMALGISAPSGYTSFNSKYVYMELTNQGFPPGLIPSEITAGGIPSATINSIKPLSVNDNPDSINFDTNKIINAPLYIVEINAGKSYTRIIAVKNLENAIITLVGSLAGKKANLQKAYNDISYWNNKQAQDFATYSATPSTTQTCYPTFSYYPYYSSRQNCYTTSNISKNISYSTYTNSLRNYNNAISNYNGLVVDYNSTLTKINTDIKTYKTYEYN